MAMRGDVPISIEARQEGVRARPRLAGLVALGQDRGARARGARGLGAAVRRRRREAGERSTRPDDYEVVERTAGGGGTDSASLGITDPTGGRPTPPRPSGSRGLVEAAWTVLDASPPPPGGAPKGSPRRRPRPGQDARPRRRGRWAYAREMGIRDTQPARTIVPPSTRCARDARGPAPPLGRLAARRSEVATPVRRPTHRLACPRPRLGDGGPLRAGPGRRNRASASNRLDVGGSTGRELDRDRRRSSRSTTSGDRPAARISRTRRRRRPSRASGRPTAESADDVRIAGCLAPEQTAEPDFSCCRSQQVASAHDQVDALAEVVDDHGEHVRPIALGPGWAGHRRRRRPPRRTAHRRSIHRSIPPPAPPA